MEPKQKQYPVVNVTGDRSKVQCCKEQCCIGNWNVRSMNQGKLEVVKQEIARVNVEILGISELKWTQHSRFLCNIALYSIGPCFYHQSHAQLGIVFALATSLHSFCSYFSTDLRSHIGHLLTRGVPLSVYYH